MQSSAVEHAMSEALRRPTNYREVTLDAIVHTMNIRGKPQFALSLHNWKCFGHGYEIWLRVFESGTQYTCRSGRVKTLERDQISVRVQRQLVRLDDPWSVAEDAHRLIALFALACTGTMPHATQIGAHIVYDAHFTAAIYEAVRQLEALKYACAE